MSASPIARQVTQNQNIPLTKRVVIDDANQLPADYSSTPGGTLYSTTPGGEFKKRENAKKIFYTFKKRSHYFWGNLIFINQHVLNIYLSLETSVFVVFFS